MDTNQHNKLFDGAIKGAIKNDYTPDPDGHIVDSYLLRPIGFPCTHVDFQFEHSPTRSFPIEELIFDHEFVQHCFRMGNDVSEQWRQVLIHMVQLGTLEARLEAFREALWPEVTKVELWSHKCTANKCWPI